MKRSRSIKSTAGAAAVAAIALVAAGCGGDSGSAVDSAAASAPPKTASGQAATIGTTSEAGLGTILVETQGRTLYLFQKDSGTKSACFGACATAWPPLRDGGNPTVDSGLTAALLGTISRPDGMPQVTYNGHPLYLYSGDQAAGEANGQGSTAFGAGWFALTPGGDQVSGQASSSGGSVDDAGSSGYGGGY